MLVFLSLKQVSVMDGSTYSQISVFHAIVEARSIRGASRQLDSTPSSVSKSLKALENHFGLLLFSRDSQKLELTDEGAELYTLTKDAMLELDSAVESIKEKSSVAKGKIKLTLPRFGYQIFLSRLLRDFHQQYPEIELELLITDSIVDIVKEGIEIGIRFGDRISENMVAKRLTPDFEEAIFASPDYLDKHGMPNSLEELSQHTLVNYRFSSQKLAPFYVEVNGERIEMEMQNSIVVNDTDAVVDCAINGLGIGRILYPVAQSQIKSGTLRPVMREVWANYTGLFLYFPQKLQNTKRVRAVIDFLTKNEILKWN